MTEHRWTTRRSHGAARGDQEHHLSTQDVKGAGRARAYSYVRFSTPEQAKGDSYLRQTEKAAKYALEHGLTLDTELTFEDLGVSAFRGRNASTGRLGEFVNAVEDGRIAPGSYL